MSKAASNVITTPKELSEENAEWVKRFKSEMKKQAEQFKRWCDEIASEDGGDGNE